MRATRLWLLLLASCPAVGDDEALGRLFFTPEQRRLLDRQRLQGNDNVQRCDGLLIGSGGGRIRWINGVPGRDKGPPLAVGQTSLPGTGERLDLLPAGQHFGVSRSLHKRNE